MSLLVTGASGHFARAAAARVAEIRGGTSDLVLTTRTPDSLPDTLRAAEVRYADFSRPEQLAVAFEGVTRMLLISADDIGRRADWHRAAIDAAQTAGVGHVIYTSMIEPVAANPAVIAESHRATEEYLVNSGLGYTILRCALYGDFQAFEAAEAVGAGEFRHNRGDQGCSYVARADCAAVAAAVLASGDDGQAVVDVTGSESLTADDLAALYSEVSGREITPVEVTDEELTAQLQPAAGSDPDGHAQYGVELAVSLGRAIREGFFAAVSSTVHDITGKEPQQVRDLLAEHSAMLRSAADPQ